MNKTVFEVWNGWRNGMNFKKLQPLFLSAMTECNTDHNEYIGRAHTESARIVSAVLYSLIVISRDHHLCFSLFENWQRNHSGTKCMNCIATWVTACVSHSEMKNYGIMPIKRSNDEIEMSEKDPFFTGEDHYSDIELSGFARVISKCDLISKCESKDVFRLVFAIVMANNQGVVPIVLNPDNRTRSLVASSHYHHALLERFGNLYLPLFYMFWNARLKEIQRSSSAGGHLYGSIDIEDMPCVMSLKRVCIEESRHPVDDERMVMLGIFSKAMNETQMLEMARDFEHDAIKNDDSDAFTKRIKSHYQKGASAYQHRCAELHKMKFCAFKDLDVDDAISRCHGCASSNHDYLVKLSPIGKFYKKSDTKAQQQ